MDLKGRVRDFWNAESCGEVYAEGRTRLEQLDRQAAARDALEPRLAGFARFAEGRGRDVLEIGVGMGADHLRWARDEPRRLIGIDLTPRAIEHTAFRLSAHGFRARVLIADSEQLPFADASFDLVYSWGVIHHTPDTAGAVREIHRVLKPGGRARVMIYHARSLTVSMLWLRYALARGRPFLSRAQIVAEHLESPGTKAYTVEEARELFGCFSRVHVQTVLALSDLLEGAAGQRHQGPLLRLARAIWPRPLIRRFLAGSGLDLLIEATR